MSDAKGGLGAFLKKTKTENATSSSPVTGVSGAKKDVAKNWKYIGIGFIGMIILSTAMFSDNTQRPVPTNKKEEDKATPTISTTPIGADKQAFEAKYGKDQAAFRQELEALKLQMEKKDKEIEALKTNTVNSDPLPSGLMAPPSKGSVDSNSGGLTSLGSTPPAPPVPPRAQVQQQLNSIPLNSGAAPALPPSSFMPMDTVSPISYPAPSVSNAESSASPDALDASGSNARVKYTKNKAAGMIPAGAFAPIVLLNGIDAGTSDQTKANPVPVLMNVTDFATLPGAAKYNIKKCFVLGSGYGDPSSERVYMRFSRISCTSAKNKFVLSQEVAGYVVDSDGKVGLRGVITERQGALLYKSALAGFAQGLTGALGSAQGTVLSNLTTGTTSSSITGDAAIKAAGLSGAQSASAQLAEFYLKQAQNVFSVISVDSGRIGTIVFTNSANLTWNDGESQFVEQVTPTNN